MEPLIIIPLAIAVAIACRLIAGNMDSGRIEEYIQSKGGKLLSKHWTLFGNGWAGTKNARIYEITYKDKIGNLHSATVKTNMLSGVYFTEDNILKFAETNTKQTESDDLYEENKKLKEEIRKLKQR